MHIYEIVINGECRSYLFKDKYDYGAVKDIELCVGKDKCKITFQMKSLKSKEDFLRFKVSPFKDAYSKCYLLHVLLNNCGLIVNSIDIYIDNEKYSVPHSDDFPLLYSMIPNTNISLNSRWKELCGIVIGSNKTKMNTDTRYAAVYSYILSKGREYEFDRFNNLWTSINAVYTYVEKLYEASLRKEFNLSDNDHLNKTMIFAGKDSSCIGMMSYLYGGKYRKITADIARELREVYLTAESYFCNFDIECIDKVYNDFENMLNCETEVYEQYSKIYEIIEPFNVSLFAFMTLGYPYYWRCRYFHGNSIEPLFMAYNDNDLIILRMMNYFMDRFLDELIPQLFDEDFWNDEKYQTVLDYIKNCESDANKKYSSGDVVRKKNPN